MEIHHTKRFSNTSVLWIGFCLNLIWLPHASGGTVMGDLASQMQPGTWVELNTGGFDNGDFLYTGAANILQYSDSATWDPNSRRLLFAGAPHYEPQKFIIYDEASNMWQEGPFPFPENTVGHAYDHNTLDPVTGDFYFREYYSKTINKYGAVSGSWTSLPPIPSGTVTVAGAIEYFPERNGIYYIDGDWGLFFYNSGTNQWAKISDKLDGTGSYHNIAEYNPVHKVIIGGGGNGSNTLYKIDTSGTVTRMNGAPVGLGIMQSLITVDPVSGLYLVFTDDGRFFEYDITKDAWTELNANGVPLFSSGLNVGETIETAVSTHGVIMFVKSDGPQSGVYIYKHSLGSGMASPLNLKVIR